MEKKIDFKNRMRQIKFITENCLTEDQQKRLIRDKLERAERYSRYWQVQQERTLHR